MMPKKGKNDAYPRREKRYKKMVPALEDDEIESIASDVTDSTGPASDEENQVIEYEVYENKVREAMDLVVEKSVNTRVNALTSLTTAFQKRVMTTFLMSNHQTMSDLIERSLKKGKGMEQVAAAKLAAVLILNLIDTDEAELVYNVLHPALVAIVQDPTVSTAARKESANALAIVAFLACPEPSDLPETLNILHNIFCCALPKGDGVLPNNSQAVVSLHAAALQGVCLLLTVLSYTTVYTMAQNMLDELKPVLATADLNLRIMVGEALALVHECARFHDDDFKWKKQGKIIDTLNEFVTESNKYKGKKDKKVQRSSFRDIIVTIKDGDLFSEAIMVGPSFYRQELILSTWALRFQYQALCHSLEEGLNCHMTNNIGLRKLFDLGPPPDPSIHGLGKRSSKRPNRQTPDVKARILNRGKNRDNRAADLCYDDAED